MEHTIRQTTTDDLTAILELIHEFHEESLNEYGVICDNSVAIELMPRLVKTSMVLEHENKVVGVIAGFITTHIVSKEPLMQEVVWFVSKEHRRNGIKLYKAFEIMCEKIGMKQLVMGNMGEGKAKVLEKFFLGEGYKPLEILYIKDL